MEKEEAKLILNLEKWPPADVLAEMVELEVFSLRDYFLRNSVIPVLYKSRIRKLLKLQKLQESFFSASSSSLNVEPLVKPEAKTLKELFRFLESQLAASRQKISKTLDPSHLECLAEKMIEIQSFFEENFKNYCEKNNIQPAPEEVKAADHINTALALRYIKNQNQEALLPLLEKEFRRISK